MPAIAGIVLMQHFDLPVWVLGIALSVSWIYAWFLRGRDESWLAVALSVMLSFALLASWQRPKQTLPYDSPLIVAVQVGDIPYASGRWMRASGEVGYYRTAKDPGGKHVKGERKESGDNPESGWRMAGGKLLLYIDTAYRVKLGDQFVCRIWVNPVDSLGGSYAKLMTRRGFTGKAYVTRGNIVASLPYVANTPRLIAGRMQQTAVERLGRLPLGTDERAVATTMSAGWRGELSRDMRAAYSRVGASHVLAVSGLHVGIVFLLLNLLLRPLSLMRRGHVARCVIVVAAIWSYAAMTGLSPSVVRAAFMFSGVQAALALSRISDSLNIILGTAFVMLALDPNYLYDISFQLSFLAVLSLVLWYRPAYSRLKTRYGAVNFVVGTVLVGVIATLGTAPMVAYAFGNYPLIGVLVNPLVVMTSHVIVMVSVLWIVAPVPLFEGAAGMVLDWAAGLQNRAVVRSASVSWASYEGYLPGWWAFAIYMCYIAAAVWYYSGERKREFSVRYDQ